MPPIRPLPTNLATVADQDLAGCKNLGLILDKYQPWKSTTSPQDWSLQFRITEMRQHQPQPRTTEEGEAKGHWLACSDAPQGITRIDPRLHPNNRIDTVLYNSYFQRWITMIQQIGGSIIDLKSASRLVIGLGSKGTLETGLFLHHHAGFPWIPGSALKGLARTWATNWLADQWHIPAVDNNEYLLRKATNQKTPLQKLAALIEAPIGPKANLHRLDALMRALKNLQNDRQVIAANSPIINAKTTDLEGEAPFMKIRQVFGGLEQVGEVVFFGGMADAQPVIVTEILTPHYNQYYQSGHFPLDTEDKLIPNAFLALEKGQTFSFGVAPRSTKTAPELVKTAQLYLKRGLCELGVGAKTSSGMGLFE